MTVFLSYSSEDLKEAESVYYELITHGHKVFFDKKSLPIATDYNSRIKEAIDKSDMLIFCISPKSASRGAYTLTELKFAEEKWAHPKNRVLPVVIKKIDFEKIPNYLKAVTILEPVGNIAAEVVQQVNSLNLSYRRKNAIYVSSLIIGILAFSSLVYLALIFLNLTPLPKTIYGNLIQSENGQPIENASLRIFSKEGRDITLHAFPTDSNGFYIVEASQKPKRTAYLLVTWSDCRIPSKLNLRRSFEVKEEEMHENLPDRLQKVFVHSISCDE